MNDYKNSRTENSAAETDELLARFTDSFGFDRRLFRADVRVSIAYADALFYAGVLTRLEAEKIRNGLEALLKRADFDKNYFRDANSSDVHSFIETKLIQLIGETGGKLQIGRSRADQEATALRLWLREEIEQISRLVFDLQKALFDAATRDQTAILPAYAHRRRAAPILWAHWCLAYFEMFVRDRERLDEVWRRTNILPLGAANAAGNSFEIDREALARELDFEGITINSLDAVSDRDFAVEFVGACSLAAVHLSRLAEDFARYASAEFDFVIFPDDSILSPENGFSAALETVRAKAGRIFGHQTALLSTLKNLPLAYSRDLIEDKEAIFDAAETIENCLKVIIAVVKNSRVNREKMRKAAADGYSNATELADYLIKKNLSVRAARATVEKIIAFAVSKNKELNDLSLKELREFAAEIEADVFDALSLDTILANKSGIGGTAPEQIAARLEEISREFEREN